MNNEISVKPVSIEDASIILELQKLAYQSEADLYPGELIAPMVQTLESMEEDVKNITVLKAMAQETIVGSVRAHMEEGVCHINRLLVDPKYQGSGIGVALLNAIEAAFASQTKTYHLETGNRSTGNLRFYANRGYHKVGEEKITDQFGFVHLEKKGAR
jgi:GNAT superfamily N-acetyltransferase